MKARTLVRIQDHALVIDARSAKRPGIVRLGLRDNPYLSFLVRSDEEGSHLGYTGTAGGPFTVLASFADRNEADRLLSLTLKALARPPFWQWALRAAAWGAAFAIGFVLLLWILNGLLQLMGHKDATPQQVQLPQLSTPDSDTPKPGTPGDADSLLQPPS